MTFILLCCLYMLTIINNAATNIHVLLLYGHTFSILLGSLCFTCPLRTYLPLSLLHKLKLAKPQLSFAWGGSSCYTCLFLLKLGLFHSHLGEISKLERWEKAFRSKDAQTNEKSQGDETLGSTARNNSPVPYQRLNHKFPMTVKKFLQCNNKKTNNPNNNGQSIWKDISSKKIHKWLLGTWKDTQLH